jgi:hypothetical protein
MFRIRHTFLQRKGVGRCAKGKIGRMCHALFAARNPIAVETRGLGTVESSIFWFFKLGELKIP